jgi:hypothetical protein
MKRLFGALFVLVSLSFSFVACGSKGGSTPGGPTTSIWISAQPLNIEAGQATTVSWSSSNPSSSCNATGDTVEGWNGQVAGSGSRSIGPLAEAKAYTFGISCPDGTATVRVSVSVPAAGDQNSFVSSDGLVTITIIKFVPGRDTVVPAGGPQYFQVAVDNRSDKKVSIYPTVVNSPDENPGKPGTRSQLLSSISSIGPNAKGEATFGFSVVNAPESVPWVRFTGDYDGRADTPFPAWGNMTFRVGWKTPQ